MNCSASIVYSNSWIGQTAALTSEPVTTLGSGIFRITWAADAESSGSGYVAITGSMSDSLGDVLGSGSGNLTLNPLQSSATLDAAGGNRASRQSVIDSPGSLGITFSTTVSLNGGQTLTGYNVYIIIEQLT